MCELAMVVCKCVWWVPRYASWLWVRVVCTGVPSVFACANIRSLSQLIHLFRDCLAASVSTEHNRVVDYKCDHQKLDGSPYI